jgi:hypothetical protein
VISTVVFFNCRSPPAAYDPGRDGFANNLSFTNGAGNTATLDAAGAFCGSDTARFELDLATRAVVPAFAVCVPALAGAVGAGIGGADSSRARSLAVSFTGRGTGYLAGTEPNSAYV